jgi:hypothetical protein
MNKNLKNALILSGVLVVAVLYYFASSKSLAPMPADSAKSLALCLSEKGVKFYGASWCSHCNNQKSAFGESAKYLPYVECTEPDGQAQTTVCTENNITGYPTWVFQDGSRESGELSMEVLAEKSGCVIEQ